MDDWKLWRDDGATSRREVLLRHLALVLHTLQCDGFEGPEAFEAILRRYKAGAGR